MSYNKNGDFVPTFCIVCEEEDKPHIFICGKCHSSNESYCSIKCQKKQWPTHKISCFPIPEIMYKNIERYPLLKEGLKMNLFNEYQAVLNMTKKNGRSSISDYDYGRHLIYKGLIEIIIKDKDLVSLNPNIVTETEDIVNGYTLMKSTGFYLWDNSDLLWCFMTPRMIEFIKNVIRIDQRYTNDHIKTRVTK